MRMIGRCVIMLCNHRNRQLLLILKLKTKANVSTMHNLNKCLFVFCFFSVLRFCIYLSDLQKCWKSETTVRHIFHRKLIRNISITWEVYINMSGSSINTGVTNNLLFIISSQTGFIHENNNLLFTEINFSVKTCQNMCFLVLFIFNLQNEPRHEKTCFLMTRPRSDCS